MFKKIILVCISIIFIVGISYWIYQLKIKEGELVKNEKITLDQKNCTYVIENKNITLIDGYSELEILPGSVSKIITRYFGNETSGDFNGDGFSDVVFLLTQESGGSGTFYYVTVALGGENGCKGTNAVLLGDRIAPQTTEFREGEIIINYADRQPGEPMTASPSVGVSRYLKIIEGQLVEDETAGWQTYENEEGGYLFKYPNKWNAVTNKYNSKNALFGPETTGESGYGGVEFNGTISPGQSLNDFVKEFNSGVESGSISETATTVNGQSVIISILPKAATESTETKSVSFEKDGKVFNMYLMYKTNFAQYPEDKQRLAIFDQMLSTFKFIEQKTADWQTYRNEEYSFSLILSQNWQGYFATTTSIEYGWKVVIRHPQWTETNPYEDIPILVYSIDQWKKWEADNFEDYPTAAPFGPSERGRNAQYVFATAPRYNYDYRTGWEDVENIIKTLKTF